MPKPTITLFYQYNPWQCSIGGIQTLMNSFMRHTPPEFSLRLVGTGCDPDQKIGQWHTERFEGRSLEFMPVVYLPDDNVRKLLPTSVRYTAGLRGLNLVSDFMHFHRIEYALASGRWQGRKTLFVHNDIHQQIAGTGKAKDFILWNRFPAVYFALERRLLQQFSEVLSCNSEATALYQKQYPDRADCIRTVKNTVDTDKFYPLPPEEKEQQRQQLAQKLNLPETTRFVLFAGRLHPQKDPLLLVNAIAALQDKNIHLLMAGDGELAEAVRTEIEQLGLGDRITLLGALPLDEIAALDRTVNAFVLSSAYEGLPLVALEVLASGTPIVTTRCGDTPHLLSEQSGVVCEARTPEAIAAAIEQVLGQPEHYPAQACVTSAKPYSVTVVLEDIFTEMLSYWSRHAPEEVATHEDTIRRIR